MMKRALIFVCLFASSVVFATVVKPMTVEELALKSAAVVEGSATETWTGWNPQRTRIYTYTRVAVSRALKGAHSETVVVKQIGGSAGGYTQHVAGVRAMSTGERAVLFLRPSTSGDGTMVVVGLMQGHFRIARDSATGTEVVSNGNTGAEELEGKFVKQYRGAKLTLEELESRVRKAAARE